MWNHYLAQRSQHWYQIEPQNYFESQEVFCNAKYLQQAHASYSTESHRCCEVRWVDPQSWPIFPSFIRFPRCFRLFNEILKKRDYYIMQRSPFFKVPGGLFVSYLSTRSFIFRKFIVLFRMTITKIWHMVLSLCFSLSCSFCPQKPFPSFPFPVSHLLKWSMNKHKHEWDLRTARGE